MPPRYTHIPLKSARSTRVIHLKPSLFKGPLICSLVEVYLDENPLYKALSYTWDGQTPDRKILCDENSLLVTANCEAALLQFRHAYKTVVLWIDGICIDQTSIPERNQQVAIMGEIYMGAEVVLIWLGGPNPKANVIFKFLEKHVSVSLKCQADGRNRDAQLHKMVRKLRASISWPDWEMFHRSWFSRVWTLQEAILAKSAVVYCGNDMMDFRTLLITTIPYWLGREETTSARGPLPVHRELSKAYASITIKATASSHDSGGRKPNITEILASLHNQESTDPKNIIFSLYFIFKQMDLDIAAPDYLKPCTQVYTEMAKVAVEHDGRLDILHQTFSSGKWPELPSWVPDWSSMERPTSDYFETMQASGHSSPRCGFHADNRTLSLSGVIIDTIKQKAGISFGEKDGIGTVSRNRHQLLLDPDGHNLMIRQSIQRIGVFCQWVAFISTLPTFHTAEALQIAFTRIMAGHWFNSRFGPRSEKVYLIFKICVAVDEDGPQEKHCMSENFQETTIEEAEDFNRHLNMMVTPSINSTINLTKAQILALGIPRSWRDFVKDPYHKSLIHTREFRVCSAITQFGHLAPGSFLPSMAVMTLKDIFVTEAGYLGAAPKDIQNGDKIVLFAGCKMPMVVREVGDKYRIMGPAHIPGCMMGEKWPENEGSLHEFMIV